MGHPTAALNSHKYWLAFSRFSIWVKFLCLELRKQRYRKFQSLIVACSLPVSCISRLSRFYTIPPLCFSQISLSLSLCWSPPQPHHRCRTLPPAESRKRRRRSDLTPGSQMRLTEARKNNIKQRNAFFSWNSFFSGIGFVRASSANLLVDWRYPIRG